MVGEVRYNVCCRSCGQVWQPEIRSPLWWKAKKHSDQGFIDAINVSPVECGCEPKVVEPDAPYRVVGFDDLCSDFDMPFFSLPKAAKLYLKLARDFSNTVFFVDLREAKGKRSRVHERLEQLKWL